MTRIVLGIILALSVSMADELKVGDVVYSKIVKQVYIDATSKESIGRLMPTNAIKVLDVKGDRIKFEMEGYQNPTALNILYFSPKARIIALAFAKNKTPNFEILKSGDEQNWSSAKISAWTDKGEFTKDVDSIFIDAKEKFSTSCSICHKLHKENEYLANRWPSLFQSMLSRTPIDKKDEWAIIQYLQKHAQDTIK